MKKCKDCGSKLVVKEKRTKEGLSYNYYSCRCGNDFLDMKQLEEVADKFREMKKHRAKLSRWGKSLGVRIPKDLEREYFRDKKEVDFIPEKDCIKIIPV
ncbi:MAG: hypothetical protein ABH828_03935 [archaeon]